MVEIATQFIIITAGFLICCKAFNYPQLDYTEVPEDTSIRSIAKRDLTIVGAYNSHMYYSFRTRCINIWKRSICNSDKNLCEIADMFTTWYNEHTYDPGRIIENVILTLNAEFTGMSHEQLERIKNVGYTPDLPEVSKLLKFNDYLDIKALDEAYLNITRS